MIHTSICIYTILELHCGEGNGNPLQCSCLENPRDRGAWWAAVYGVAQSRTRLKRLSSCSKTSLSLEQNISNLYASVLQFIESVEASHSLIAYYSLF